MKRKLSGRAKVGNLGIIRLSPELLFDWLQFKGAKVRRISVNAFENSGVIDIVLEHPEMPTVYEGDALQVVTPVYTVTRRRVRATKRLPLT